MLNFIAGRNYGVRVRLGGARTRRTNIIWTWSGTRASFRTIINFRVLTFFVTVIGVWTGIERALTRKILLNLRSVSFIKIFYCAKAANFGSIGTVVVVPSVACITMNCVALNFSFTVQVFLIGGTIVGCGATRTASIIIIAIIGVGTALLCDVGSTSAGGRHANLVKVGVAT